MILPFGSSDSDVIAHTDFSSVANVLSAGGIGFGTPTLGSDGYYGNTTSDYIQFLNLTGNDDAAWAGQLSIEVMTKDIATDDIDSAVITEYNSNNGASDVGYIVNTLNNGGLWNNGLSIYGGGAAETDSRITIAAKTGTTVANRGVFYNSNIISAKTTITVSWIGRSFKYFINGVPADGHTGAARPTANDWLYRIVVGKRYIAGSEYLGRYITNFQLAKRPVENATIPLLSKVAVFGDSFAAANTGFVNSYAFQAGKVQQMQRVLLSKGLSFGGISVLSQAGHTVQDSVAGKDPLDADRALVAAEDPTLIIFQAGANDSGAFNATTFETDMKDHITYFVNNCDHLKGIVVGELPVNSNDGRYGAAHASSVNAIYNALPDWFNTTFSALAGKLVVADMEAKYGDSALNYGIADTLHPSAIGMYRMGEAWGEAIMRIPR